VLAAILVLAAGAGCGGGDGDEPTADRGTAAFTLTQSAAETRPEAPADQSTWAREVEAACESWQERLDALEPPTDAAELGAFLDQALPLIRGQVEAVQSVEPPPDAVADSQRLVAQLRRVADALGRYGEAVQEQDAAGAQTALAEAGAAGTEARASASELGVTRCGGYSGG
jgi:hypothetical protein